MADERVQAAIRNWAGRFIANGIDYNDFTSTTATIDRWDQWLERWTETAEVHLALAETAAAAGRERSAGEAYAQAAVTYHFSKFVWVLDPERNRANTHAAIRCLYEAHARLDPTAERVEAAMDGGVVVANLRRPPGAAEPAPLVVLMRMDIRPEYELAVAAILDAVAGRPELDGERIGAVGVSLGGHYVVRAAAFEPRITALAGVSGPYDFAAGWDTMPALTRETVVHHTGASSEAQARSRAAELNLDGVAERVSAPCLVVTGKLDRVIAWEQTKRIADAVPGAEWVLFRDGTHVCNNIPFKYRPLVADWMWERLA
jgi:hypothetical protein